MATGLFVGLVTLDWVYLTTALPQANQKLVALDYEIAAGGPATNAAVAFQHLSNSANSARLMGVIGSHPVSRFVLAELQQQQIQILDLQPSSQEPLPTSSILVTEATAERAVISINATRIQAEIEQIPAEALTGVEIVLIDGHQIAVGQQIAAEAQSRQIPVVVDGGSWKSGFEEILAHTNYAICSENFLPPHCRTTSEAVVYLQSIGIAQIAITRGAEPILVAHDGTLSEIPVPVVQAVDTLGAGDVFHGAFCYFILKTDFETALSEAAQVAAQSCLSFGTRQWIEAQWMRQRTAD